MARPNFLGFPINRLPGIHFLRSFFKSQYTSHTSPSLLDSSTFRLINPRGRNAKFDAIRQTLTANEVRGMSEEAILAAFAKGFFAGFAFTPEEVLMRLGAYKLFNLGRTGWCSRRADSTECRLKRLQASKNQHRLGTYGKATKFPVRALTQLDRTTSGYFRLWTCKSLNRPRRIRAMWTLHSGPIKHTLLGVIDSD
jgi:hypothetical protein